MGARHLLNQQVYYYPRTLNLGNNMNDQTLPLEFNKQMNQE
jgi:hypothetical protein